MASGRVDAGPPILKTLSSPQSGEGFPPLTPPTAPAQPAGGSPGKNQPFENVEKTMFFSTFPRMGPQGSLKDPPRIPKDPSGTAQGPPRALQGPPKQPPRPQKDPQCPPKNLQMLKTQQKPMVFQCFHKPPNGSIRATQAPPGIPKDTPSTP